jgi:PAS domain S-box-containing protein
MADEKQKSPAQEEGEADVEAFRQDLGPFVVAAEKTRMPMVFVNEQPGYPVIFANDAFLRLTGYAREEVLAKNFGSLLAAGVDANTVQVVESAFRGSCDGEPELHYKRKDGSEFWATMFVSPVCDQSGAVVQQFVSLVDLTSPRLENARYKLLIDELNHRVKNTLSTVQAIINQALRQPAKPAEIRAAIESRLMALSRAHDLLTETNWDGVGLHDLVVSAIKPFGEAVGAAERFTIVGENVHLSPKISLALAIAINELATNSLKYGAISNDVGKIAIEWAVVSHPEGDRLVLRWQERDGPPVSTPIHKGFGSWVLEHGLTHELGGRVALAYESSGVTCTIEFPLPAECQT